MTLVRKHVSIMMNFSAQTSSQRTGVYKTKTEDRKTKSSYNFRPFKLKAVIIIDNRTLSHANPTGSSFCSLGRVKLQNEDPRSNALLDAKRHATDWVFVL